MCNAYLHVVQIRVMLELPSLKNQVAGDLKYKVRYTSSFFLCRLRISIWAFAIHVILWFLAYDRCEFEILYANI